MSMLQTYPYTISLLKNNFKNNNKLLNPLHIKYSSKTTFLSVAVVMSEIYAELPEDTEDIYADLEDELNKAGYDPGDLTGPEPVSVPAPALPTRNQTGIPARESPQPVKQAGNYKAKKEKQVPNQKKVITTKQPTQKPNPAVMGAPMVSKDMLNQRRLLKKVGERNEPHKSEDSEVKVDFRANLRKVAPSPAKKTPPLLKPKPSVSALSIESKKICYKRRPLTVVDLSNPPVIDREKKPRLILDPGNDTYDNAFDDGDLYDDVEVVRGSLTNGSESTEQDVYDDVENMNPDLDGDFYDDVENIGITRGKSPELYDDVENVGIRRGKSPELYDDVESVGITRGKSPELYDDVENVGIPRSKSPELYDDVESIGSLTQSPMKEELYDEVPESKLEVKGAVSRPKLSASQEKKFRKKQQEMEKKRQKEIEKNAKEMEKKRKVFFEYYNIKEGDKPLLVAQVTSENDLRGKQNLVIEVGAIVHVLCKQHKKMPKGAWLAEKADKSAIGFIAPDVLNQNMLPTYDDTELYSTTD